MTEKNRQILNDSHLIIQIVAGVASVLTLIILLRQKR
jgi:hypothetical protein